MKTTEVKKPDNDKREPYRMRLPGFISGDVIKRATYAIGVKPCGGCERRAKVLNRWMVFSGRQSS
jgi:hypothetical protein